MEVPRAQPKPPGDDPVALRWPFAKRHAAEQPPLVEPRGCLKDKKQWESGHTAYKPCLEEPLVLILGRAPRAFARVSTAPTPRGGQGRFCIRYALHPSLVEPMDRQDPHTTPQPQNVIPCLSPYPMP